MSVAAAVRIQSLAWELPYATGIAKKKKNNNFFKKYIGGGEEHDWQFRPHASGSTLHGIIPGEMKVCYRGLTAMHSPVHISLKNCQAKAYAHL